MTWVQWAAIWFIASVVSAPFIGNWLYSRRINRELRNLLNTSEAQWAVQHREWMARRQSGQNVRLSREALIEAAAEECREWEGAFSLDEDEQPHKPAA